MTRADDVGQRNSLRRRLMMRIPEPGHTKYFMYPKNKFGAKLRSGQKRYVRKSHSTNKPRGHRTPSRSHQSRGVGYSVLLKALHLGSYLSGCDVPLDHLCLQRLYCLCATVKDSGGAPDDAKKEQHCSDYHDPDHRGFELANEVKPSRLHVQRKLFGVSAHRTRDYIDRVPCQV